jgi:hypothetical protein
MMSLLDIKRFWPAVVGEQPPAGQKLIANFSGLGASRGSFVLLKGPFSIFRALPKPST